MRRLAGDAVCCKEIRRLGLRLDASSDSHGSLFSRRRNKCSNLTISPPVNSLQQARLIVQRERHDLLIEASAERP